MLKVLQDKDFMNLETIKTDIKEFIDQMRSEKWYVGILLRGSRATQTEDSNSDYDLMVIVDRDVYAIGYELTRSNLFAHYNLLNINQLYAMCDNAYRIGQRDFFTTYSRAVVIDEVWDTLSSFIAGLPKDIDLREYPISDYSYHMKNREIQNIIAKIREKNLVSSSDIYDRVYVDKVLIDIFERYAWEIYYDRFLNTRWREKARRRLYDKEYATKNNVWLFPDKKFLELWEKIYSERTVQNFDGLIDYIWNKIEKKPKLKRIYAYGE